MVYFSKCSPPDSSRESVMLGLNVTFLLSVHTIKGNVCLASFADDCLCVSRPVCQSGCCQRGEPEIEVREPGSGSVHWKPHVCLQCLPDHWHQEQTKVRRKTLEIPDMRPRSHHHHFPCTNRHTHTHTLTLCNLYHLPPWMTGLWLSISWTLSSSYYYLSPNLFLQYTNMSIYHDFAAVLLLIKKAGVLKAFISLNAKTSFFFFFKMGVLTWIQ